MLQFNALLIFNRIFEIDQLFVRGQDEVNFNPEGVFCILSDVAFDSEEGRLEDEHVRTDIRKLIGLIGHEAEVLAILLEANMTINRLQ